MLISDVGLAHPVRRAAQSAALPQGAVGDLPRDWSRVLRRLLLHRHLRFVVDRVLGLARKRARRVGTARLVCARSSSSRSISRGSRSATACSSPAWATRPGFTEWSHWARRLPLPRRRFAPTGAYRWLRHPVYLSFAGLIWFTPRMTLDHALLTAVWSAYLAIGSYLKDERLAHYMGDEYRRYQEQVPGYPLVPSGPLGRRKLG